MLNEINRARADLNLLTLFDVILRERHVGRAAARLNLTPSAVSHGLGRLRRLLTIPFLRTPKGVVPTARAMALAEPVADLLARARNVLASADAVRRGDIDAALRHRRAGRGVVGVSAAVAGGAARPRSRHRYRAAATAAAAGRSFDRAGMDATVCRIGNRLDGHRDRADRQRAAALCRPAPSITRISWWSRGRAIRSSPGRPCSIFARCSIWWFR